MKSLYLLAFAGILLCGCGHKPDQQVKNDTSPPLPPGAAKAGPSDGITPLGAGAGPMTPVVGGQNIGATTGGGIGSAATEKARKEAAAASARPGDESDTTGQ